MSTDTDRLEKEAESHRSNLDATFDAIRDRLSVGQIVDEFSGYLKEGQGADTVKNLGRQVRDNPLALGLVGAGLAWLFLGDGARRKGHDAYDRYDRWREDREYDRFEEAFPGDGHQGRHGVRTETTYPAGTSRVSPAGATTSAGATSSASSGPGMGARVSDAAGSVGSAGSRAAAGASNAARSAGESISQTAGSARDSARRGLHDAGDAVSDAGSATMDAAQRASRRAYRSGARAQRNVADLIHDEPLVFGAVALAIGAAVGAMLPATRREDEWMGETRDNLRDEAYARGRDTLHKAENVASKAYDAASEEASAKGLKPDPNKGDETLAEKASDVLSKGVDTAKSESKKEGLS